MNRIELSEQYPDVDLLFMDPECYDKAIIGVAEGNDIKCKVAYDYDKVIRINEDMGMTQLEAIEYFEFNQLGAYVGEHTPLFITQYK